jgi:hypothetical protein
MDVLRICPGEANFSRWENQPMTRFKELRRIEDAIEHKDASELGWALDYCTTRRKLATTVYSMRKQAKYWQQMESKVRAALESSK